MNIIIVGAGTVGFSLAEYFYKLNYHIAIMMPTMWAGAEARPGLMFLMDYWFFFIRALISDTICSAG